MAIQLREKNIGDIVKITVDNVAREFIVVHKGRPSTLYETAFNNTVTLLMANVYTTQVWNSPSNSDYENSQIRSYLENTFINLIDSDIRNQIVQVRIPYRPGSGNNSTTINYGANGLLSKVFLLGNYEIGMTSNTVRDGDKLDYFIAGLDATAYQKRAATNLSGGAASWWMRTPATTGVGSMWYVNTSGGSIAANNTTGSDGVRPALVLPDTLYVTDDGTITTSQPPVITSGISGDMGTKDTDFTWQYAVNQEDNEVTTVVEKIDGVQINTYTATLGATNTFSVTGKIFLKLLNGVHTMTVTATGTSGLNVIYTVTFTKEVRSLSVTLDTPLPSISLITRMIMSITGSLPNDADLKILVTNNANDITPIWEDATHILQSGFNHVFANQTAMNGNAFNFKITASRGTSNEGGFINTIGGAFE